MGRSGRLKERMKENPALSIKSTKADNYVKDLIENMNIDEVEDTPSLNESNNNHQEELKITEVNSLINSDEIKEEETIQPKLETEEIKMPAKHEITDNAIDLDYPNIKELQSVNSIGVTEQNRKYLKKLKFESNKSLSDCLAEIIKEFVMNPVIVDLSEEEIENKIKKYKHGKTKVTVNLPVKIKDLLKQEGAKRYCSLTEMVNILIDLKRMA